MVGQASKCKRKLVVEGGWVQTKIERHWLVGRQDRCAQVATKKARKADVLSLPVLEGGQKNKAQKSWTNGGEGPPWKWIIHGSWKGDEVIWGEIAQNPEGVLEVEHVEAHRVMMEEQRMSLFERFIAEGNEMTSLHRKERCGLEDL